MKSHDMSNKLKDLLHKIEVAIDSTDTTTFLTVGELLKELQLLAADHDPKRVMTILGLLVQLHKKKLHQESEEKNDS